MSSCRILRQFLLLLILFFFFSWYFSFLIIRVTFTLSAGRTITSNMALNYFVALLCCLFRFFIEGCAFRNVPHTYALMSAVSSSLSKSDSFYPCTMMLTKGSHICVGAKIHPKFKAPCDYDIASIVRLTTPVSIPSDSPTTVLTKFENLEDFVLSLTILTSSPCFYWQLNPSDVFCFDSLLNEEFQ